MTSSPHTAGPTDGGHAKNTQTQQPRQHTNAHQHVGHETAMKSTKHVDATTEGTPANDGDMNAGGTSTKYVNLDNPVLDSDLNLHKQCGVRNGVHCHKPCGLGHPPV